MFAGVLASYGCWRWLAALVKKKTRWLRSVWPTGMLLVAWLLLWLTSFPGQSTRLGPISDILVYTFFGANIPGVMTGNLILSNMIGKPEWVQGLTASVAVWLVWYGIIRGWEWWARRKNVTASLS